MPLIHLASRLYGTPLLIARSKLDVILSVLGPRVGLPDRDALIPDVLSGPVAPVAPPGMAVIPIYGTLVRRAMGLEVASGMTSYAEISARLESALADPRIHGILLDIDSPGGEAGGVFELADKIRAARAIKPIWAHANDSAFSAAYALAAAADRLTLSQTAGVGSIGVIALHVDQSVKDAKDGLTYSAIYAGHHKNDFSPHQPLTPQAAAALQGEVDRLYSLFVTQVSQMRGLEAEAVRSTGAGLFFGEAAVAIGLADAVTSLDQVLAEFSDQLASVASVRGQAASMAPGTRQDLPSNLATAELWEETCLAQDSSTVSDPLRALEEQSSVSGPTLANGSSLRREAQAIAELCLMARAPERTASFLASNLSEAQVRRQLLQARADQSEITSYLSPDISHNPCSAPPSADGPVVVAARKLAHKE